MKRPWQFSLKSLLLAMVVVSIIAALIARFGARGVVLLLMGSALSVSILGAARRNVFLIFGGLFGFVVIGTSTSTVSVWDGHKTIPLRFTIVDAESQNPIAGADVRLREIEFLPRTEVHPGEKSVCLKAASDGSVTFVRGFPTSGREGTWEHTGYIYLSTEDLLWIQSSADGYETKLVSLEALAGKSRDISDPIPPAMRISLVPKKASK